MLFARNNNKEKSWVSYSCWVGGGVGVSKFYPIINFINIELVKVFVFRVFVDDELKNMVNDGVAAGRLLDGGNVINNNPTDSLDTLPKLRIYKILILLVKDS